VNLQSHEILVAFDRSTTNLENLEYSGISMNTENSGNSVQPQGNFNKQNSFSSMKYWRNTARSWASNEQSHEFRRWSQCVRDLLYCWSWCGLWNDPWHM